MATTTDKNKVKRSKAEIEKEIRQKVALDERAHLWVEKSALVNRIELNEFTNMVNEIMMSHYKDIIEERSISKLCGYPLCANVLPKIVKKQYHVSMVSNKVYDLTERKFFCSSACFKSSKYIESQIPESPLWLRNESVEIKLLEDEIKKEKEAIINSDHIVLGFERLTLQDLDASDSIKKRVEKKDEKVDLSDESSEDEGYDFTNVPKLKKDENCTSYARKGENCVSSARKGGNINSSVKKDVNNILPRKGENSTSSVKKEAKILIANKTIKMFNTVENPEKEYKDMKKPLRTVKLTETVRNPELEKSINIIEKLDKLTDTLNEWFTDRSYCYLKSQQYTFVAKDKLTEEKNFENKVMNFFSSTPEWVKTVETKDDIEIKSKSSFPDNSQTSQQSIRRKIAKEKITNGMNKVLGSSQNREIAYFGFYKLIDTFNFTSTNIILKHEEWLIVAIYVLKIFATSNCRLSTHLKELKSLSVYIEDHLHGDIQTFNEYSDKFVKTFMFHDDDEGIDNLFPMPESLEEHLVPEEEQDEVGNMEELD